MAAGPSAPFGHFRAIRKRSKGGLFAGPGVEGTFGLIDLWGKHEQEPWASGTRLLPSAHSKAGLEGEVLVAIVTWW